MGVNKGFTNAYERSYNKGLSNPHDEAAGQINLGAVSYTHLGAAAFGDMPALTEEGFDTGSGGCAALDVYKRQSGTCRKAV